MAVIEAASGEVWFAPFTIEDGRREDDTPCDHASDFKIDSELFVATGRVNDRVGTHYYVWRGSRFSPVYFEKGKCL